jgi:hypothetical protein
MPSVHTPANLAVFFAIVPWQQEVPRSPPLARHGPEQTASPLPRREQAGPCQNLAGYKLLVLIRHR